MTTQKPSEWAICLLGRFEEQVTLKPDFFIHGIDLPYNCRKIINFSFLQLISINIPVFM